MNTIPYLWIETVKAAIRGKARIIQRIRARRANTTMDAFETIIANSYTQHEVDIAVIRAIRGASREILKTDMYAIMGQYPQTWNRWLFG